MSLSNTLRMRLVVVRPFPLYDPRLPASSSDDFRSSLPCVFTVKAYGELPENAKINETDTFGEEEGECTFEFGDDDEVDIDDI